MSEEKAREELQKAIEKYIDRNVKVPAFETIEKDFYAQGKLAEILVILTVTVACIQKQGLDIDKDYAKLLNKQELEKNIEVLEEFIQTGTLSQEAAKIMESFSSRKYLLAYLLRELNWVAVSVLSASYVSAHIIMRSVFELLVGIATKKTGSMSERIKSIPFLSPEEQKEIQKLWGDLCSWSHPYNKWTKEMCPIFVLRGPMYHPVLCKQCLEELEKLLDLLLVVGLEKFEVNREYIVSEVKKHKIDTSNLTFFQDRC